MATKKPVAPRCQPVAATPRREVPVMGRSAECERLAGAFARGAIPDALLLTGPRGVGKQRLAWWIASALLCEGRERGRPCGACRSCALATALQHPDVLWYMPHPSVGGGSPDAQHAAVTDALLGVHEAARADALATVAATGVGYYVATIAHLRRAAAFRSAHGGRRVIILGDVDRLAAADGRATEAANALLKLLEEPPPGTHFVLTSSRPHFVPRTVRSRVMAFPVRPLDAGVVADVLGRGRPGVPETAVRAAAAGAAGSVGRAADLLEGGLADRRAKAVEWLMAAFGESPEARLRLVKAQGFADARGAFSGQVEEVLGLMHEVADAIAFGRPTSPEVVRLATAAAERFGGEALARLGEGARAAVVAHEQAQGNANPQLVLHVLLARSAGALPRTMELRRR